MKKITVSKDDCIACGYCIGACPDMFEFGDDAYSQVKKETVEEVSDQLQVAIEGCPTGAIKVEEA